MPESTLPVFQVAEQESWSEDGIVATSYGERDICKTEEYELPYDPRFDLTRDGLISERRDCEVSYLRVSVRHLIASQDFVYWPHVSNLRKVKSFDVLPEVRRVGEYYVIQNGHHRVCAMLEQGDRMIYVKVVGEYLSGLFPQYQTSPADLLARKWYHGSANPNWLECPYYVHIGTEKAAFERLSGLVEFDKPRFIWEMTLDPSSKIDSEVQPDEGCSDYLVRSRKTELDPRKSWTHHEYDALPYRNEYEDAGEVSLLADPAILRDVRVIREM